MRFLRRWLGVHGGHCPNPIVSQFDCGSNLAGMVICFGSGDSAVVGSIKCVRLHNGQATGTETVFSQNMLLATAAITLRPVMGHSYRNRCMMHHAPLN